MTIYLAPPATDEARPVGGRLYRKQVLKKGPLRYTAGGQTRTLNFDDDYMHKLVTAFREQAYDSVPFVLADEKNRHTMAPERARGEVVDVEATPDGLDAIVRLSSDAATLVDQNPKFGVSARIVEGLTRGDGKSWPVAMQHVLGTFDPRVTGMRPWEAVDLSTDGHDVIDLTDTTQTGVADMAGLTEEELAALRELAKLGPSLSGLVASFEQGGANDGADEDFEEYDEDFEAGELAPAGGGVVLSNEHEAGGVFDLSDFDDADEGFDGYDAYDGGGQNVELSAVREELAGVRAELAKSRWESERADLLAAGVPPVMLDKAEVLLANAGASAVIELSNGESVDPVAVLRDVLAAAKGVVDLSAPLGHGHDLDGDEGPAFAALEAELDKMDL